MPITGLLRAFFQCLSLVLVLVIVHKILEALDDLSKSKELSAFLLLGKENGEVAANPCNPISD